LVEKLKRRHHLEDLDVDRRIISKFILKEQCARVWTGLFVSGYGPVAGSSEHDNGPSGSIKGGGIVGLVGLLVASQQGLYSMDLLIS
jgi:hypothetical protein